jgi:pimeloyl-ACP methyl ester carboxylesterase
VRTAAGDGTSLWWEARGEGEPVLLLPGRGDSSDIWDLGFLDQLVAGGAQVIVYDQRDTGLSGLSEGYDLYDLVDDAVLVLDAAGVDAAHVVGLSMGGIMLVDLSSRCPQRVRSATFIAGMSPDPQAGIGPHFFPEPGGDPTGRLIQALGETTDADRAWAAEEIARAERRAPGRDDTSERHQEAALRAPFPEMERLGQIDVTALVIHGTDDRVLPVAHAEALAAGIGESRLVLIEGMGHLPRPALWRQIADEVLAHIT